MIFISRSTALKSGFPVYISALSRFASAAVKQSAKDIFSQLSTHRLAPTVLAWQELFRGAVPRPALAPSAIARARLFALRCSAVRPNSVPQSRHRNPCPPPFPAKPTFPCPACRGRALQHTGQITNMLLSDRLKEHFVLALHKANFGPG